MLLLAGFAFLSGVVTIFAPCIWPLLPIVMSSSVADAGKKRPLGITLGIMASFTLFTLGLSTLVKVFNFDPNNLRTVSAVIIALLGAVMILPALSRVLESWVSRLVSLWGGATRSGASFVPGFVTGLSLGVVWAPCAGPILATIAALAATGRISAALVVITCAYAAGVGVPLFFFAYGSQRLIVNSRRLSPYTARIQQIFGVIMILTSIAIYTNYDKVIEAQFLNRFPFFSQSLNAFEQNAAVQKGLLGLKGKPIAPASAPASASDLLNAHFNEPELSGISTWLNTPGALTLAGLKGKVVLVDFWTYTCINCIRTLPHVTAWYDKYKESGFTVIGVHTPEFEFEKSAANVAHALVQYHIAYPVAQDNAYATWDAFQNEYWPAEYLIDAQGIVRRVHFGEGEYDQMERAIQELLAESGHAVTSTLGGMPDETPRMAGVSPESYLGSERAEFYYPDGGLKNQSARFVLTESPPLHSFSLGGEWTLRPDAAVAGAAASLAYHFNANKVFLVLRPPAGMRNVRVKVYLDGAPIASGYAGADVQESVLTIDRDRLYSVVDLHGTAGGHVVKLEFESPGTEAFAFTFG